MWLNSVTASFLLLLTLFYYDLSLAQPHKQPNEQQRRQQQQENDTSNSRDYRLMASDEIHEALIGLRNDYPNLFRLSTAQQEFNLSRAGEFYDCPLDAGGDGCLNYFAIIQDFLSHPESSLTSNRLPSVLISGALHGDERVGPTSVIETARLLLEAASCEALPTQPDEIQVGLACRQTLRENRGISDRHRQWLARLVATRRIVIVPTPNALGYARYTRTEDNMDPNRDFPFDQSATQCMRTIAGRTLNELFRQELFQLALTYHGGTELIGYEWGAPSWYGYLSPDHNSQDQLAAAYSRFGGSWNGHPEYPYGPTNDLLYYVKGGMEDWAYAASWDTQHSTPCEPTTYEGYPREKTVYSESSLRVFNMLIETSRLKTPSQNDLGTSEAILDPTPQAPGNGHIPRSIRTSLATIDLVEPYVSIIRVDTLVLQNNDIVPHRVIDCQSAPRIRVPSTREQTTTTTTIQLEWTVGGAITIDETRVYYAKVNEIPSDLLLFTNDCFSQPNASTIHTHFRLVETTTQTGRGYFSKLGVSPEESDFILGPGFTTTLDLPFNDEGDDDEWIIIASARVDSSWDTVPLVNDNNDNNDNNNNNNGVGPDNVPPQAHIVQTRTNPDWFHTIDSGRIIQGRTEWFSKPIFILTANNNTNTYTNVDADTATTTATLLNDRFRLTTPSPISPLTTAVPSISPGTENNNNNNNNDNNNDNSSSSPTAAESMLTRRPTFRQNSKKAAQKLGGKIRSNNNS